MCDVLVGFYRLYQQIIKDNGFPAPEPENSAVISIPNVTTWILVLIGYTAFN